MNTKNCLRLALLAMLSFIACQQEQFLEEAGYDDSPITTFEASVEPLSCLEAQGTKSTLDYSGQFIWESDDVISFWPGISDVLPGRTPACVEFKVAEGGQSTATFIGNGWALKRNATYYASKPFRSGDTYDKVTLTYSGQSQAANDDDSHLGEYDYLHAYLTTPSSGSANITFDRIGTIAKFVVRVPESLSTTEFKSLTLTSEEKLFSDQVYYDPSKSAVTLSLSNPKGSFEIIFNEGEGFQPQDGVLTVYAMMPPTSWSGRTITAVLTGIDGLQYSGTFIPKSDQSANKKLRYEVSVGGSGTPVESDMVDLGLSVKWSSCNLGASSIEESGDYYAWGETETKDDYSLETYKFYKIESVPEGGFDVEYKGYTKYVSQYYADQYGFHGFYDSRTVLEPEDDVAHLRLGDKWRMPTRDELQELCDNCQCDWVTYKGVKGMRFTSKKTGYTDKWIFLPAAGYRYLGKVYNAGSCCYYWSLSLGSGNPNYVYNMDIDSGGVGSYKQDRYYGQFVRPVYGDMVKATGVSLDRTSEFMRLGGETTKLYATLSPSDCPEQGLVWSSSNPSVATVSGYGEVAAVSPGSAEITVSWVGDSSIKATCIVTVTGATSLVPSGFIQKGQVFISGAVVCGDYTINPIKMYNYFTLDPGGADPHDFYAKVTYKTPTGEKFGNSKKNRSAKCCGVPGGLNVGGDTYYFNTEGSVDKDVTPAPVDFNWGDYTGLMFTASAQLYKKSDDEPVGEPLVFNVVTPDPIQKVVWGSISDKRALNVASSVYLYQNVEVYGCLAATKNLCFYNSNEMYAATLGHPWVTFTHTYDEDGNITGITNRDDNGNRIYGQDIVFNYDPVNNPAKVYANGVEQRWSDIVEGIDNYRLKIKSVSVACVLAFEIPAKLTYASGLEQTGTVIVVMDIKSH